MTRILCLLILSATATAADISPRFANDIADAIHRAEGGPKASVPYGVLSVRVVDAQHAREVCLATIPPRPRPGGCHVMHLPLIPAGEGPLKPKRHKLPANLIRSWSFAGIAPIP